MVGPVELVVMAVTVVMVDRVEKAEMVVYGIESSREFYKKSGAVITTCSSGFFFDALCSCCNG
ncbi:hypothetical protein DPB93_20490 [Salmonella enterica subsp. salamae]|nr:hypothetical protein [Salmonella enterica subsp. salamae]